MIKHWPYEIFVPRVTGMLRLLVFTGLKTHDVLIMEALIFQALDIDRGRIGYSFIGQDYTVGFLRHLCFGRVNTPELPKDYTTVIEGRSPYLKSVYLVVAG